MRDSYPANEVASIHSSMVLHEAMIVTGELTPTEVRMKSPYNPELVSQIYRYKPRLGEWNGKGGYWAFPIDKLDEVKKVYRAVFGEDGFSEDPKVVVEIDLDKAMAAGLQLTSAKKAVWILGQQVISAMARAAAGSAGLKEGDGVTIVAGGFTTKKIDVSPWVEVVPSPGTVIVLSNVSSARLATELARNGTGGGMDGIKVNGASVASSSVASPTGTASSNTPAQTTAPAAAAAPATGTVRIGDLINQHLRGQGSLTDLAGQMASGQAAPQQNSVIQLDQELAQLDDAKMMAYGQLDLILKSMALRASQLPADVAANTLAPYGLKTIN